MELPLEKVELHADVFLACIHHALSTENYEVMGLLIGDLEFGIASISAAKILRRSDKKKDRVEISSEQVLKAAAEAERLTAELKRPMRVLGWYHSHPHITVCPSHVDVRTQATYQTMDHGFVGLIFSVFSAEKDSKKQEALVTCFQSHNGEAIEIPVEIIYTRNISAQCSKTMTDVARILMQEEEDSAEACKNHPDAIATIYNNAVHTKALAHIIDMVTRNLLLALDGRLEHNKIRVSCLQRQLAMLQKVYTNL